MVGVSHAPRCYGLQLPTLMTTRVPPVNLATLSRLHSVPANDLLAIFMLLDDANPLGREGGVNTTSEIG